MSSVDQTGPGLHARTSPYVNPFAPIYPSMPFSQFVGRMRAENDGLFRMGRPGPVDADGFDDMGLRYNARGVAVALRMHLPPHKYGEQGWRRWRRRCPGPAGHLTAEEAAAFAGFHGEQRAQKVDDHRWRWAPGVLSGLVPEGWVLECAFDGGKHELLVWRAR